MAEFFVLPVISEQEYPAFRRAVGANLADTYDQWAKLFADDLAEARRRGDTIVDVEVKYDEFIGYCRANGKKPDPQILLDFALLKKAAGQSK